MTDDERAQHTQADLLALLDQIELLLNDVRERVIDSDEEMQRKARGDG